MSSTPADVTAATVRPRRVIGGGAVVAAALISASLIRAGNPLASANTRGLGQVADFFAGALHPETSHRFLALTWRESLVTLSYAVVGTALAVGGGLVGAVILSRRWWDRVDGHRPANRSRHAFGWRLMRWLDVGPRSLHEVVWGLVLLNILGLDPFVAVLAIAIPFGAISAQVFADVLDETPPTAFRALRAAGAPRLAAMAYSIGADARADLAAYGFYRFECAIRSAAVLGIIGAGGLGFQLQLSFTSLRYGEVWTLLYALIILSGAADLISGWVRRRSPTSIAADGIAPDLATARPRRAGATRAAWLGLVAAVPVAWWQLDLHPSTLWSARSIDQARTILPQFWPPTLRDGWRTIVDQAADTVSLAVLPLTIAFAAGMFAALVAAGAIGPNGWRGRLCRSSARAVLLFFRAVPPPVWAIVILFVVLPGTWPGAIALGVYNMGVLGRLFAEVVENAGPDRANALVAQGARRTQAVAYSTVPDVWGRFMSLGLYRWEVAIRETVVVGVVGAGGLGRALDDELSAFAWSNVAGIILALIVVTFGVDALSRAVRPR